MTHAGQESMQVVDSSAEEIQLPVCEVSVAAAIQMFDPMLADWRSSNSVICAVSADRMARSSTPDALLGIAPSLLVDPSRSGVRVPRYQLQEGKLPADAIPDTAEQAVVLWLAYDKDDVAELRIPEGLSEGVWTLADAMQMRGGGPVIFHRGEANRLNVDGDTAVHVIGGANNAPRERIETTLTVMQEKGLTQPLIATVDRSRNLKDKERKVVAAFAPHARNEYELFLDSARDKGFTLDADAYGVRSLPDGSFYVTMTHSSGQKMIVFAPKAQVNETGKKRTGLFNAYHMFQLHGQQIGEITDTNDQPLFPEGFSWQGRDIVHVSGTHYGPMAAMNNLEAVTELGMQIGSFKVIGDNQPGRTDQAHLIEIGNTLGKADTLIRQQQTIRMRLLRESA